MAYLQWQTSAHLSGLFHPRGFNQETNFLDPKLPSNSLTTLLATFIGYELSSIATT